MLLTLKWCQSVGARNRLNSMGNANIELDQLHSDDETEKSALAAVEAIKRVITERHALRGGLAAKERELARLRERLTLVRESYQKLANELVTQLQLFERLEREEARSTGSAELHWLRGEQQNRSD
jgi:hypothetical protein